MGHSSFIIVNDAPNSKIIESYKMKYSMFSFQIHGVLHTYEFTNPIDGMKPTVLKNVEYILQAKYETSDHVHNKWYALVRKNDKCYLYMVCASYMPFEIYPIHVEERENISNNCLRNATAFSSIVLSYYCDDEIVLVLNLKNNLMIMMDHHHQRESYTDCDTEYITNKCKKLIHTDHSIAYVDVLGDLIHRSCLGKMSRSKFAPFIKDFDSLYYFTKEKAVACAEYDPKDDSWEIKLWYYEDTEYVFSSLVRASKIHEITVSGCLKVEQL